MLERTLRTVKKYTTATAFALAISYAGCGGEEPEPECRTNRDCLQNCIDHVIDAGCNYSNPSPGQVEQCRERGIIQCNERYSSGNLRCGRYCGERMVQHCRGEYDTICEDKEEPYCENSCSPNQ